MKKEAKLLLDKSIDSLILSVEFFNRPWERGRSESVLILLDHSFELFLKSAILHKGGSIRSKGQKNTIGFEECLRQALSNGKIKFLTENQVLVLQPINNLRDAAQHHLLDISEQHLYFHTQSGLTLYKELFKKIFNRDLNDEIPTRVLPVSTVPLTELNVFFENEINEVKKLLQPTKRKKLEAITKLRSLTIFDRSIQGEKIQPSHNELKSIGSKLAKGEKWENVFPAVGAINFTTEGYGPSLDLRITKKEGIPVQLVPEGTPNANVIAIKRVNELDFYSLGHNDIAEKLAISPNKTTAAIWFFKIKDDNDSFREFKIGNTKHRRYSTKAIDKIKDGLRKNNIDDIWKKYCKRNSQ